MFGPLSDVQMSFRGAGARVCAPSKTWGFARFTKTMAGVGHLKRICKDAFSVAGAVQETCSSEMLGGQGADFLRGVAFWSIKSSGLLRWFCVTGVSRTVSFLMLSTSKNEEVSQNCFVFDVVKCKNCGSLAELLRSWWCQVQKLRKSRRLASF